MIASCAAPLSVNSSWWSHHRQ